MKYLSILSVLLLIGGNFSFAMEDGDTTPSSEQKNVEDNIMETQNDGEEQMNNTRAKVRKMEMRHRRGRLRPTQQEPMFDNSGTINIDGETTKL